MAEKEERIWIGTTEKKIQLRQMTRQDAIERISKALHKESTRISNMEKDFDKLPAGWRKSFYNYAEAALNALLEEEKEVEDGNNI